MSERHTVVCVGNRQKTHSHKKKPSIAIILYIYLYSEPFSFRNGNFSGLIRSAVLGIMHLINYIYGEAVVARAD